MFPTWRLKIREAKVALRQGRWDEASALLAQDSLREFLPAKRLSQEVASHLVSRAKGRLEGGDSVRGWQDLQQAARLGGSEDQIAELQQSHAQRGLQRVRQFLISGETALASEQIARLQQRRLGGEQRRAWKLIVHLISRAQSLASAGNASAAGEMLQRAGRLLPDASDPLASELADRQAKLQRDAARLNELSTQLHQAIADEAWLEVLRTASALLELAPEHAVARQARRRAWQAVGMEATQVFRRPVSLKRDRRPPRSQASTHAGANSAEDDTMSDQKQPGKRLVAWVDGVGAYLLCLGDEIVLGQPGNGSNGADVPIRADLSRRHATIRRDGEAYVITPIHRVSVDGKEITGPTLLANGAVVQLGDSARLKFRRPHALSATAVLTLESHHRTEPTVDGIVLMSDSCILGPQSHSHIPCRTWEDQLVLFRRDDQLQFRTSAAVEIDGEPAPSGGTLAGDCRVEGEAFALSLEQL